MALFYRTKNVLHITSEMEKKLVALNIMRCTLSKSHTPINITLDNGDDRLCCMECLVNDIAANTHHACSLVESKNNMHNEKQISIPKKCLINSDFFVVEKKEDAKLLVFMSAKNKKIPICRFCFPFHRWFYFVLFSISVSSSHFYLFLCCCWFTDWMVSFASQRPTEISEYYANIFGDCIFGDFCPK